MIEAMIRGLAQLAILRPGLASMIFALAILMVKAWRTKSKRTKYTIKDFWRYPDDLVIVGGSGIMFLAGLGSFLWRMLS